MGGDGHLQAHAGTSQTGEGHGCGDHDSTDDDTEHILPDADNPQSLPASTGVRTRPPDKEDAPPVSREIVIHHRHLHCENDKARRMAAMTKQSCQPPRTNRITRSQVKISANALIIMAKAVASTSINCSVSNSSGPVVRVRVPVGPDPFPNWRSGSSIHPNRQFGYGSMDISQPI